MKPLYGLVHPGLLCCIASDPTEDTERDTNNGGNSGNFSSCIASDPTEDTESQYSLCPTEQQAFVASPPIRPRILKG